MWSVWSEFQQHGQAINRDRETQYGKQMDEWNLANAPLQDYTESDNTVWATHRLQKTHLTHDIASLAPTTHKLMVKSDFIWMQGSAGWLKSHLFG